MKIQRGVQQGNNMPLKLFTLVPDDVYKRIDWGDRLTSLKIYRQHCDPRNDRRGTGKYADTILVDAVHKALTSIGNEINFNKTKYITSVEKID